MPEVLLRALANALGQLEALSLTALARHVDKLMDHYFPVVINPILPPDLWDELWALEPLPFLEKIAPPTLDPLDHANQEGQGARSLLAAIVRRAIYDWLFYRNSKAADKKKRAEDAYIWLFEENEDHLHWYIRRRCEKELTSFKQICIILDYDMHECRALIKTLTVDSVQALAKVDTDKSSPIHEMDVEIHADVPYSTDFEDLTIF